MFLTLPTTSSDQLQSRLLRLAAVFLILYSLALTLSPAARLRTWQVEYRWDHWLAVLVWLVLVILAHRHTSRWLSNHDPFLLPVASLLSGWGLLTVWRLYPVFGLRQTLWLMVTLILFIAGLRLPFIPRLLRRYKYLWLTTGLLLTALTLLFGTNPSGTGFPHLWLGCCGVYFQPSEPLKILLVVYLAAYLADRVLLSAPGSRKNSFLGLVSPPLLPLLAPTLIMTGLAMLLLLVQRDLGTASIFVFLYTAVVYVTSGRKEILLAGVVALVLAGVSGYLLFDVVRVRIDAWLNPWLDPSGRSYQIVQSLIAVANGGLIGRGPGLGSPQLVPVPHSDFVFVSIAEESGLVGSLGLLLLVALFAARGMRVALRAGDTYRRYLAAGLTAHLAAQSILIIGGNLRLLPLTGVTLPFVSYGGSSLLASYFSLLVLLHISNLGARRPAPLRDARPYLQLHAFFLAGIGAAGLLAGWWALYRSPALLSRTDNPRRAIADQFVQRGSILDRQNQALIVSNGETGSYTRQTFAPDLGPVLGYNDPVYGQSGLEASLDSYLRGVQGNPGLTVWWHHLLYGMPPPGLDVRLTLDGHIQSTAGEQLGDRAGAIVLFNAESGEILAMASHPGFDPDQLGETWDQLVRDPQSPLLNRATLGLYPPGPALGPLLLAAVLAEGEPPELPNSLSYSIDGESLQCSVDRPVDGWAAAFTAGCPGPVARLGETLGSQSLLDTMDGLGLYTTPLLGLPADSTPRPTTLADAGDAAVGQDLRVSPVQMALAAAALSAGGERPAPRLVSAVDTPQAGWVMLPVQGEKDHPFPPDAANLAAGSLAVEGTPYWQSLAAAPNGPGKTVTWYLAGTLPEQGNLPLVIAVLLEEDNPDLAMSIGQTVMNAALSPGG